MWVDNLFEALENAADGAFIIDEDQRIVFWNQAAQELLGYTPEEVIGRACYEIIGGRGEKGQMLCRHHCYVTSMAFTGGPVTSYDTLVRTKSGETNWINVTILTFPATEDSPVLVVHLFRDATQKQQSEQFAQRVLEAAQHLQTDSNSQPGFPPAAAIGHDLTEREIEVLSLLAQGLSTREIAQSLSISLSTARNHIQSILNKLNVHSRVEAVAYAFEHGLV